MANKKIEKTVHKSIKLPVKLHDKIEKKSTLKNWSFHKTMIITLTENL